LHFLVYLKIATFLQTDVGESDRSKLVLTNAFCRRILFCVERKKGAKVQSAHRTSVHTVLLSLLHLICCYYDENMILICGVY